MLYRTFPGIEGSRVSALGFGFMRLPLLPDHKTIDEETSMEMVRLSLEAGVNYWDTAWGYHEEASEPFVGRALARFGCRDRVSLASKSPVWIMESEADWERVLDVQLGRLGASWIDYYMFHALDAKSWEKVNRLKGLPAMERALADGRIKRLGFSFHDDYPVFEEILLSRDWNFCQIQYNYMDVEKQAGKKGLELAASRGIGVIVMEPLRGGGLAKNTPKDVKDIFGSYKAPRTAAEWALRFALDEPGVVTVLSGMSSAAEVLENGAVCSAHRASTLSPEERTIVEKARAAYKARVAVPCTACRYCMPCPSGVDIPGIFDLRNTAAMFDDKGGPGWWYHNAVEKNGAGADKCTACGQCEAACPQKIGIIESLKEAGAFFSA